MRAARLAQAFAKLLDQFGVALSRPLIFARCLDIVQLVAQPVFAFNRPSPASSSPTRVRSCP